MYVEDRITSLCDRLLASTDPDEARAVARDLQEAIHDHVEDLRIRAHTIPFNIVEIPDPLNIVEIPDPRRVA